MVWSPCELKTFGVYNVPWWADLLGVGVIDLWDSVLRGKGSIVLSGPCNEMKSRQARERFLGERQAPYVESCYKPQRSEKEQSELMLILIRSN